MHGAKSALITYVQFKFHVIDLKGNYSHGWIASADTSVIIFSSIFNTSSTFYTCFPVLRSNWGRLLRLAHLATFFRRLILSTSHVFFHQPTVLKKLKAFQLWGRYLLNCEMGDFVTWSFSRLHCFRTREIKKGDLLQNFQRHVGIFVHVVVDFRLIQGSFRYQDVLRNETKFPISRCRWKRDLMSSACPLTRDNQLHTFASKTQKCPLIEIDKFASNSCLFQMSDILQVWNYRLWVVYGLCHTNRWWTENWNTALE